MVKSGYAAFLDVGYPWARDQQQIERTLKVATLRGHRLILSDSQALDHPSLQAMLRDESFLRFLSTNPEALEVLSRGNSLEDLLQRWLQGNGADSSPTYLSALSPHDNEVLEAEFRRGTLNLARFKELYPKYWSHVVTADQHVPLRKASVSLKPNSYQREVLSLLAAIERDFEGESIGKLAVMLGERWAVLENPTRTMLRRDLHALHGARVLSSDDRDILEIGIVIHAYHANYAKAIQGRPIVGKEISSWHVAGEKAIVRPVEEVPVRIPRNSYLDRLTWQGVSFIRNHPDFVGAQEELDRDPGNPVLVKHHQKAFLDAWQLAADKGAMLPPGRPVDARIILLDIGVGSAIGAISYLAQESFGFVGATLVGAAGAALTHCTATLLKSSHDEPNFANLLIELAPPGPPKP